MKNVEILVFLFVAVLSVLSLSWYFDGISISAFNTYTGKQVTDTIIITKLEVNDFIGKHLPSLTEFHLLSLRSGKISTPKGNTDYTQTLRLRKTSGDTFDGAQIVFEEDENDQINNFLKFSDQIFEYEINFEEGLRSKIEDGKLVDLHDRYIELLGKQFAIIDSSVNTNNKIVSLTLSGDGKILEFKDTNYGDNKFNKGTWINNKNTEGNVNIFANVNDDIFTIALISYRPNSLPKKGTNIYVPQNYGIRDFMRYPEGLIMDGFEIVYLGLIGGGSGGGAVQTAPQTQVSGNPIIFSPGGNGYDLQFTNNRGQTYKFRLLDNQGGIKYGKGGNDFHFREGSGFFISKGDFFLITSEASTTGVSNILKYDGADTTQKVLFFEDLAGGSKSVVYDADGNANFVFNGYTYPVIVDTTNADNIKIDLNRDGTQNSGTASAVILGGGALEFSAVSGTTADIKLRTKARLFEERTTDETTTIRVSESDSRLDVEVTDLTLTRDKDGIDKGMTTYGALFLLDDIRNPSTLTITYPGSGSAKARTTVGGSTGTGSAKGTIAVTFERFKFISKQ